MGPRGSCGALLAAAAAAASARPRVGPLTCADLSNNGTFDLSYEGSWSYLRLDPASAPYSFGSVGYRGYSDWAARGDPLLPSVLSLTGCSPAQAEYTWRPDYAAVSGACGGARVSLKVAYHSNATVCARYDFPGTLAAQLRLRGSAPSHTLQRSASVSQLGGSAVVIAVQAGFKYGGASENVTRWFRLRSDLPANVSGQEYSFAPPAGRAAAVFCLDELYSAPADPGPPPEYDPSATTASINGWLAEASRLPAAAANRSVEYYSAWFQFWFNTEHDAGNWVHPVITPSMSRYGRGMWLWDTGFHVFALLAAGGARALRKAQDQLAVLAAAGKRLGHIPRVLSPDGWEATTQPPGILTWASLLVYNRTGDQHFLRNVYEAFTMNNNWYYAQRQAESGLCLWQGADSGWDTSPRWDNGTVEAVDLNAWLRIDHLMLAEAARLLGLPASEAAAWEQKAAKVAAVMRQRLWDNASSVFWDRLPSPSASEAGWVKVVTPATFWGLLSGAATSAQARATAGAVLTPQNLLTAHPMPCVGRSEPTFNPNDYWRGPVWVNVNWLSAIGLDCYGMAQHAAVLRNAVTELVGMHPEPREYYNPLTGEGLGAQNFMWTGAVDIVVAHELAGERAASDALMGAVGCSNLGTA